MSRPEDRLPEQWRDVELPLDLYYDEESDPDEDTLRALLEIEARDSDFTFRRATFDRGRVVYAGERDDHVVALYDNEGGNTFRWIKDPDAYIADIDPSDFYDFDAERLFNQEFWESPCVLYHGTADIESVLAEGLEARSESRGLTNGHVGDAVFTSVERGVAETYGDVVKINAARMKRDGFRPFVAEEPDARDERLRGGVAHGLGIEWYAEHNDPAGADPNTVIVFDSIPTKYLTRT